MITAAVAAQARKLNYVEVEIVPKPSTGTNGEKPFIHIADAGVKYSTIIFPERDGKGTPRNSVTELESPQGPLVGSIGTNDVHLKDTHQKETYDDVGKSRTRRDEVRHGESKQRSSGASTPPKRRRAHSSPSTAKSKKISSPEKKERSKYAEGVSGDTNKTRTLPSPETPLRDDVFTDEVNDEEPTCRHHQDQREKSTKQDIPSRKMKKFFRTGRHVSDLGTTQDIIQVVQAMQRKVRRKSSGGSVDSGTDLGYSSNGHSPNQDLNPTSTGTHTQLDNNAPNPVRNPPPIPGSMRNTELEMAMARRKLSRQKSSDQKPSAISGEQQDPQTPATSETKSRKKFLQMLPTMKFGKTGSSSSKSKAAKQEEKSQLNKKPVPLPRYNRQVVPRPNWTGSQDSVELGTDATCEASVQQNMVTSSNMEADTYVNFMFQSREDGHNYENVHVEEMIEKPSKKHSTTNHSEMSNHHSRPMPAPRLHAPQPPCKDHQVAPSERQEDISFVVGGEMGTTSQYDALAYTPDGLQIVEGGYFQNDLHPLLKGKKPSMDMEEYPSSLDEESLTSDRSSHEVEILTLTFQQNVSVSKDPKVGCCDQVSKRNSDGCGRKVQESRTKSDYVFYPKGDKESSHRHHHKHIRSHSSGGNKMFFSNTVMVCHPGEKEEVYSAGMFPNVKMETFKPANNSPSRDKLTTRTTHEHVTLGQHVHSNYHFSQPGASPTDQAKYLVDLPSVQTNGPAGPSTQSQTPWWDTENGEDEQLEEKPIPSYINQPWYYGKLLRQECDYLMMSKGKPCQYLVRDSSHRAGGLMLCVLHGDKVHHYIIHVISNTEYHMANHTFCSVSEIIEFYRKHVIMYSSNQEPVFLGEPFLYPR
ncbi:GRB2-related adapter protein [Holothuria leucospilota]|uniref:GRB2-related adapter protein n=1 Tax=Holothuria leucospilota TaxID=206669 RepID=A0A9Q1CE74_HOLLE|nr:GRB2-related adapter protein [Holothuria leucospilota]